jgi:hypothetical protein
LAISGTGLQSTLSDDRVWSLPGCRLKLRRSGATTAAPAARRQNRLLISRVINPPATISWIDAVDAILVVGNIVRRLGG